MKRSRSSLLNSVAPGLLSAISAGIVFLSGCGESTVEMKVEGDPVPAKGKVLLPGGKPLSGATVVLVPMKDFGLPARGTTGEDGSFVLTSKSEGDGAVPGDYRIRIEPPPLHKGGKSLKFPYPSGYASEESSGLTATVKPGGNEVITVQLQSTIARASRGRERN
ncbi:carboxypeptidase-like regulatory domain-containing protein [Singulisphaera sp. PoT]|uniref:carboxypeptidase-like regulatory domain-containing protein n=1 Tax=Singulisphaera sp. PoT TaxID=3411797 RepID=UPI003BF595F6